VSASTDVECFGLSLPVERAREMLTHIQTVVVNEAIRPEARVVVVSPEVTSLMNRAVWANELALDGLGKLARQVQRRSIVPGCMLLAVIGDAGPRFGIVDVAELRRRMHERGLAPPTPGGTACGSASSKETQTP
jgi:hypothetical protein